MYFRAGFVEVVPLEGTLEIEVKIYDKTFFTNYFFIHKSY